MTTDTITKTPGRHTDLTPELQEKICSIIADGNYIETACNAVGIHKTTYYHWLERADAELLAGVEGIYKDFYNAVKKAEAKAETLLVNVVLQNAVAKREWLPAITFLERRHPDRWGRKDRTAITIDEHKQLTITRVTVVLPAGMDSRIVEGTTRELPAGE